MVKKFSYQNGSAFAVIIIILGVALVGALGFVFWQNYISRDDAMQSNKIDEIQEATTTVDKSKNLPQQNKYSIANVSFAMPSNWYVSNDNMPAYFDNLVKAVSILPGEKLRTVYGDGSEYFEVNVSVYKNISGISSKDWFSNASDGGIGMGIAYGNDMESSDSINGYDTYFRHSINDVYQDVNYALGSNETVVYIYARTYQTDPSLPGVGDFRKFEPQIAEMVHSMSIK